MKQPDIDLIITYVNCADQNWVRDYICTTKTHNPTAERFRSWGTLKYLLRGIEKYMPFVRNVVLIVARKSQIPFWINQQNVRVVLHEEFIPKEFLPTFNSCTIESFFWNIPDLADRVIYINDDMFPMQDMSETDFFSGDIPHISFHPLSTYNARNMFRGQCHNGYNLVAKSLGMPCLEPGMVIRPIHISSAFTQESMRAIAEKCEVDLCNTISTVRHAKNVNQYIYLYYHYLTNTYVGSTLYSCYYDMNDKSLDTILTEILEGDHQFVCLNDGDSIKNYTKFQNRILSAFENKFPTMSKYEV